MHRTSCQTWRKPEKGVARLVQSSTFELSLSIVLLVWDEYWCTVYIGILQKWSRTAWESGGRKGILVSVFLWSHVCLRSCLNKATEGLIFSHFLGTNIATFNKKAKPDTVELSIQACSIQNFFFPEKIFQPMATVNLFNLCPWKVF